MKKLSYLLLAVFAASTIFTSCSEQTDPVAPAVTVTLKTTDAKYVVGEKLTYEIKVVASEGVLADATITPTMAGGTGTSAGTYKFTEETTETFTYFYVIPDKAGSKVTINVEAMLTEGTAVGEGKSAEFTIGAALNSFTAKIMGAVDNAAGSWFAASSGMVYKQTELAGNHSKIDMGYYYGDTNFGTLAAPSDASLTEIYPTAINAWVGTKNATKFAAYTKSFDVPVLADMVAAANAATTTLVKNLDVNQVFVFKTQAGLVGLGKVTAITKTKAGSITVDFKVSTTAPTM